MPGATVALVTVAEDALTETVVAPLTEVDLTPAAEEVLVADVDVGVKAFVEEGLATPEEGVDDAIELNGTQNR